MNKKVYLAALHKIWITHKKLFLIFKDNNDFESFYKRLSHNKLSVFWFTTKQIDKILIEKSELDINKLDKYISDLNISIVNYFDEEYINNLTNIKNKPFIYYVRWKITLPWISFIWSRTITSYWKKVIENILPDVWKYFTIISWWAYGCDSYSHKIALDNNVTTISIIWTGIDVSYPFSNKSLYDEIILKWGWILSIFPIWEKPNPYNFPIRNEIVACLSEWIVIIEAKEKSWSLITANLWLEQWKDIFCIPWDIFKSNSQWCNKLISLGASKSVSSPLDILSEYNISNSKKDENVIIKIEDDIESSIYNLLKIEWLSIDEICAKISYEVSVISFKISILEINNLIKKSDSWKYEII